jgi:hypothetical protein
VATATHAMQYKRGDGVVQALEQLYARRRWCVSACGGVQEGIKYLCARHAIITTIQRLEDDLRHREPHTRSESPTRGARRSCTAGCCPCRVLTVCCSLLMEVHSIVVCWPSLLSPVDMTGTCQHFLCGRSFSMLLPAHVEGLRLGSTVNTTSQWRLCTQPHAVS